MGILRGHESGEQIPSVDYALISRCSSGNSQSDCSSKKQRSFHEFIFSIRIAQDYCRDGRMKSVDADAALAIVRLPAPKPTKRAAREDRTCSACSHRQSGPELVVQVTGDFIDLLLPELTEGGGRAVVFERDIAIGILTQQYPDRRIQGG